MVERQLEISKSLEDYLETVCLIVREHKVSRVKDIARARNVKMSSVTTAMKRLSEMGLVKYSAREFIELTPDGERIALRVMARHDILRRFFGEVLHLSEDNAEADACAMEHYLSNEGMDKLTRLFEYIARCEQDDSNFLEHFHQCSAVHPDVPECDRVCKRTGGRRRRRRLRSLGDLKPSESGVITQVNAVGSIRQRLLDMGMLPKTEVTVERLAPTGDPIWIRTQGFQLSLRRSEADSILIED